eukprot:XP_011660757.1 PREDICTED: receptor-type tyrosine-protein phosphatase beta isoform X1 [Strongylocentrotus purpuratus]
MFDWYYVAFERANELGNFTEVGYLYSNMTSVFLEGLMPSTEYLIDVSTVVGEGNAQTFSDGELFSAYTVPFSPANLSLGSISSCAGQVTWDIPEGNYDFFEVTYSPDHGFTDSPAHIYRSDITKNQTRVEFSFIGIYPDTRYHVTVITVFGALDVRSEPRNIDFRTESPANGNVAVTALSADSFQFGWYHSTQDYNYIRFNLDDESKTACENETLFALGNGSEISNITDLQSGQKYNVFIDQDGVCETLQQYTRPLPPVNIKTTNRQLTSLVIDWYDPGNETMFDWYYVAFERANELGNFTEVGYLYPNMTSVFLEGLMPSTEYLIDVSTVVGEGNAQTFSDEELFSAYTVPFSPANLSLGSISSCAGQVTWDIPEGNYDFFEVTYSPDHGFTDSPAHIYRSDITKNQTRVEFSFIGIYPDTRYHVTVITVFGALDVRSEPRNIDFRTESPANGNVAVTALSADSFQFGWYHSTQDYNYIRFNLDDENKTACENETLFALGNGSEISNITDLQSGQKYNVFIDQDGVCETLQQYTRPLPPVNIKTTNRQLTSLVIDWYDPGNETMFDWYYVAFERANELGNFTEVGYLYSNMTSVFLEGLMPSTEYLIDVSTVVGEGNAQTFSDGELFSAYTVPFSPANLSLGSISSCAGQVTWDIPEGNYDFFEVTYSPDHGFTDSPAHIYRSDITKNQTRVEFSFIGIYPDTRYHVTVITVFGALDVRSEPRNIDFRTESPANGNVAVTALSADSFQFGWYHSTQDYNYIRFNVDDESKTACENETLFALGNGSEISNITDLQSGQKYNVFIDQDGLCETLQQYTRPLPPVNIQTTNRQLTSLLIDWSDPGNETMFDWYYVTFERANELGNFTEVGYLYPNMTSVLLEGLMPSTEYLIDVSTVVGEGNAQTFSDGELFSAYTVPFSPANLSLGRISSCAGQVAWNIPEGDYDFFEVTYSPDHGFTDSPAHIYRSDIIKNQTRVEFPFIGILPDTDYNVTVVTVFGALDVRSEPRKIDFRTESPANGIVAVTALSADSFQVGWDKSTQDYVYIEFSLGCGCGNETLYGLFNDSEYVNFTDLQSGQKYNVFIDQDGVCETIQQYTRPLPPVNIKTADRQLTSLVIDWSDPGNETIFDWYYVAFERANELGNFMEVGYLYPNMTSVFLQGLMPSTEYLINVSTVVGEGNAQTFSDGELFSAYTVPFSPANLSLGRISSCAGQVAWNIPEGDYDFFEVTYSPDHGFTDSPAHIYRSDIIKNQTRVEFPFIGILPDTDYNVTVVTVFGAIDVRSEPRKIDFRTESPANGIVAVTALSADSFQVGWDKSTQDYVYIEFSLGCACGNETLYGLFNDREYVYFTDLQSGQKYNVFIDQDGVCETLQQYTRPLPPVNIQTTNRQLTSLLIDWSDPGNETMFDWYYVAFERANELGNFTEVGYFLPNTTSVLLEGLMLSTEYLIDVSTVVGEGNAQTFSDGELISAYTASFAQILSLAVTSKGNTEFTVTWQDLGTDAFNQYCVRYEPYEARANRQQERFPVKRNYRSARFYGLDPGQMYTVYVTSCSSYSQETSYLNESISFRLDPAAIAEIRIIGGSLGPRAVTLEWDQPEGIRGLYKVTLDPADEGSVDGDELLVNITGDMTSAKIQNLAAGHGYTVGIIAISGDKRSEDTTLLFYTLPDPPQNLILSEIGEDTARLSWAAPDEMNFPIVSVVMTTMPATMSVTLNLDTNTIVLSKLVPGETYTVRLASVIRPDDAPNQAEVIGEPQVSSPFLMKPALPSHISETNKELTQVTVTWQPSVGVVARYWYTYGISGSAVLANETTTPTNTFIQLSNLIPSTRYEFRLWAESDQTDGSETRSSDVVTVDIVTKQYSPYFTGSKATATSITWIWSLPFASVTVTNFVISIKENTGTTINTLRVQSLSHTEENLISYTAYFAVLQAVYVNVPSDPVSALPVTTLPSMPSEVSGLTITQTGILDAQVSWSSPLLPNGVIANYTLAIHISLDDGTLSPYREIATIRAVNGQTDYSQDVIGLAVGQYYVFSVYATNQVASSNRRSTTRTLFAETAPPAPPRGATPLLVSRGITTITITFYNLFDTSFGRIVRLAIIGQERVDGGTIVNTAKRQNTFELTWAEARRTRPVPVYQPTPNDYNPFADGAPVATFRVGSENCDPDDLTVYCNGALYPATYYRFAIRAYGVDGKYVDTEFSSLFRTDPDREIFVIRQLS